MASRLKDMSFKNAAMPKGKAKAKATGKDNRMPPGMAKKMGKPDAAGKKVKR